MIQKKKLAILTNLIVPSRIPIYKILSKEYELRVFFSGGETNRKYFANNEKDLSFSTKRSFGFTLKYSLNRNGKTFKKKYLHITIGTLWDLFRFQPDLIITNEMGIRSLWALFYSGLIKTQLLVWWGGTIYTESFTPIIKKVIRKFFVKMVPRWISYGKSSTDYLLSIGVEKKKILEIQNTIDERKIIENDTVIEQKHEHPILLFVGEMVERKGLSFLLDAIRRLQNRKYQFSTLLIGDGPEIDSLKKKRDNLKISNVHFLGNVDQTVIAGYYKYADFMVFPTLFDTWGLVINEALWANLPIISSKYAGASLDLLDEDYIFNPTDEKDFDSKLINLLINYKAFKNEKKLMSIEEVASAISIDLDNLSKK